MRVAIIPGAQAWFRVAPRPGREELLLDCRECSAATVLSLDVRPAPMLHDPLCPVLVTVRSTRKPILVALGGFAFAVGHQARGLEH